MSILPALRDATMDPALRGWPIHVLFYLHTILDVGEDRHIKAWFVAQEIGAKRRSVTRALRLLVDKGYLRMGKTAEGNVGSYRIVATLEKPIDLRKTA